MTDKLSFEHRRTERMSDADIEARVDDLLRRMTLEEKAGQLNQLPAPVDACEQLSALARAGKVGSLVLATSAYAGSEEQQTASLEQYNAIQRCAVEESRLGIPLLYGRDVVHGHRTVFPIPLGQAASWDPDLVREAAAVAAQEASAAGIHWTFAPMVDIGRDPRWGRVAEGFGEDPYLASIMSEASVRGFQGDDASASGKVMACLKHFLGYGAAEGGRDYNTTEISDNTLRNVYLPPFEAGIKAGSRSVMAAFHEIGGVPCSGSRRLMTELLREDLGFEGMVVSDWNSIGELQEHGVAGSLLEAAAIALDAGVDLDMSSGAYITHIVELVIKGQIPEEQVDLAVRRVLRTKFACGLFDRPYRGGHTSIEDETDLKQDLARRLARQSIVLLKNDRAILPLAKAQTSIALIGPMANARRELLGTWSIDAVDGDGVTIAEGIRNAASDVTIHMGSGSSDYDLIQAAKADVVLLALGEHHQRSGENASIASLGLPPGQVELAHAVAELGKPIVAVVCAGRPLILSEVERLATAIVYAWHPGVQGGNAIADILFGDAAPSGRLPMTFPRHDGQIPIYYGHKPTGRPTEGQYIDIASAPLYPFGFGLSYTTFSYAPLALSAKTMPIDGSVVVSTCVTNTGQRAGEEVVQLYLRDPVASVTRPVRELKGFRRIRLEPGESQIVSFTIGFMELSYVGTDGRRRMDPGAFHVWIGGDSNASQSETFYVVHDALDAA